MKILFITSNRVGDAILSTGIMAHLVEYYPEATLTIACGPYAASLFRAVPRLDGIIVLQKQTWNRHWFGLWRTCVGTQWDLIVDLRNSIVSYLLRSRRYARRTKDTGQHKVADNAAVLGLITPPAPHIWLDIKAEQEAARLLPPSRPMIAFAPAANWVAKQWPMECFIELARKLVASEGPLKGAHVLVVADKNERTQIMPFINALPDGKCTEIIGQDLLAVAACLKQCRLFVGNDSGLMHLAAAMNVPTLGLFGPGYEKIYGPWGNHCAVVRTVESGDELFKRYHAAGAARPNLMGSLSVDEVYVAACELIKRT